jgi:hypothetical protein
MRFYLLIDATGLFACQNRGGKNSWRFASDANGRAQFSHWVTQHCGAIFHIAIDHPQIECHFESTPKLRAGERRAYLDTLCQSLAPVNGWIGLQSGAGSGGAAALALVTTLAADDSIASWLALLDEHRARVAYVGFLPVALAGLLYIVERREHTLLMVSVATGGDTRLCLYCKGALLLHRHISAQKDLITEVERTLQYAHKNDVLTESGAKLILLGSNQREVLQIHGPKINDQDRERLSAFPFDVVPDKNQLIRLTRSIRADNGLRDEPCVAHFNTDRTAQRLWMASAVIGVFFAMTLFVKASIQERYKELSAVARSHQRFVAEQLPAADEGEIPADTRIAITHFVNTVEADVSGTLLRSFTWLANILHHQPDIRLQALQWHAAANSGGQHRLMMSGRIDERVASLVAAVMVANDWLSVLRSSAAVTVTVTKAPFGLGTGAGESARVNANLADRDFRIELSFDDTWQMHDAG